MQKQHHRKSPCLEAQRRHTAGGWTRCAVCDEGAVVVSAVRAGCPCPCLSRVILVLAPALASQASRMYCDGDSTISKDGRYRSKRAVLHLAAASAAAACVVAACGSIVTGVALVSLLFREKLLYVRCSYHWSSSPQPQYFKTFRVRWRAPVVRTFYLDAANGWGQDS